MTAEQIQSLWSLGYGAIILLGGITTVAVFLIIIFGTLTILGWLNSLPKGSK